MSKKYLDLEAEDMNKQRKNPKGPSKKQGLYQLE